MAQRVFGGGHHDPALRRDAACPDLLDRWLPLADASAGAREGRATAIAPAPGDFARSDPLGLSRHPRVIAAISAALARFGTTAAHPAETAALAAALAALVGTGPPVLRDTGDAAAAALRALVAPGDHILIEAGARPGLWRGACDSGAILHRVAQRSVDAAARQLSRLRAANPDAGILMVAEGLSALTGIPANLAALQSLCRRHRATLLADVSADLGATGPGGGGVAARQGMTGEVDVVAGNLAPVLAARGGFVAGRHPALRAALDHGPGPMALAAEPAAVSAAAAIAAIEIAAGPEGEALRSRLAMAAAALRAGLAAAGFAPMGAADAPVVPVPLPGDGFARAVTAALSARGHRLPLWQAPHVAVGPPRWLVRASAGQDAATIAAFCDAARRARLQAEAGLSADR